MRKRSLAIAALTAAAVIGASTPAHAHECYIANRSAQGNAGATHSANWVTDTVVGFAHSPGFPPGYDADCFVAYWLSHGGPASFTVRSNKTIGEGSANPNLANRKGLEHIEDSWATLLRASLGACAL